MSKTSKKLDLNQLAKRILDMAVGEIEPYVIDEKKQAAIELGRLGGLKGGKARADSLTPEQRSDIARNAAKKRWGETKQLEAKVSEIPSQKRHRIKVSDHSDEF